MSIRVGVDVGGTFTDAVTHDPKTGEILVSKTSSIRENPGLAILNAIDKIKIEPESVGYFAYGTTVGTNALIERKGAKTGFITTKGFRDVIRIQRNMRKHHFDLSWIKSKHLVPRWSCVEVDERVNYKGEVLKELDEETVEDAVKYLKEQDVEAIAVSLIFSFLHPKHERRIAEIIKEHYPEAYVSLSTAVNPQWREYERASTTVIDAYIKPVICKHLSVLEDMLKGKGFTSEFFILKSSGGVMLSEQAKELPIQTIKSGPVGGIVASTYIGRLTGISNLITADVGGTSFDVSLINRGIPTLTMSEELEYGVPIALPMLNCKSIGAGGGSLAWIDRAGLLKVGPQSAGANPGPACYGLGNTTPTITDANVVLGRLNPEYLLGGELKIRSDLSVKAVKDMAGKMGMDEFDFAYGMLEVTNNNMAQAIRLVSVDKGFDPRDFALIAFGGAGPVHAVELAKMLGMRKIVVPPFPGAFSAFGAVIGDIKFDYLKTHVMRSDQVDIARINLIFSEMEEQGRKDLKADQFEKPIKLVKSVYMRYVGQNYELEVPIPTKELTMEDISTLRESFELEHEKQFGYRIEGEKFELVNFRVTAIMESEEVKLPELKAKEVDPVIAHRKVYFKETNGSVDTSIYDRNLLSPETKIHGPAIIEEVSATTVLTSGVSGKVDSWGNIIVDI